MHPHLLKALEMKEKKQTKTNRNHRSAQGRHGNVYDTVDGLTVEKGSYIAVVAKDLSAGF